MRNTQKDTNYSTDYSSTGRKHTDNAAAWIVGVLVALAVIAAVVYFFSGENVTPSTTTVTPAPTSTTGGTTTPAQ